MNTNIEQPATKGLVMSVSAFCKKVVVSKTTVWRWRKRGWLTAVNISGRPYLTEESISRFMERARNGEFAKEPTGAAAKTPSAEVARPRGPAAVSCIQRHELTRRA